QVWAQRYQQVDQSPALVMPVACWWTAPDRRDGDDHPANEEFEVVFEATLRPPNSCRACPFSHWNDPFKLTFQLVEIAEIGGSFFNCLDGPNQFAPRRREIVKCAHPRRVCGRPVLQAGLPNCGHDLAQKPCEFPLPLFFTNNKRGYASRAGRIQLLRHGAPS